MGVFEWHFHVFWGGVELWSSKNPAPPRSSFSRSSFANSTQKMEDLDRLAQLRLQGFINYV
uniref:Uncharacterized protein n=3 Tax=Oryza TaxID=4527 RepID=Q7Y024_ORYSJ|nr:hypothetical protein [Oryza sativa Japonica Group]ABF98931.1 hypothetical protein LOC_Os03g54210 [Oryza sativa Japonica Group]